MRPCIEKVLKELVRLLYSKCHYNKMILQVSMRALEVHPPSHLEVQVVQVPLGLKLMYQLLDYLLIETKSLLYSAVNVESALFWATSVEKRNV